MPSPVADIRRLRADGKSYREIASALGVGRGRIKAALDGKETDSTSDPDSDSASTNLGTASLSGSEGVLPAGGLLPFSEYPLPERALPIWRELTELGAKIEPRPSGPLIVFEDRVMGTAEFQKAKGIRNPTDGGELARRFATDVLLRVSIPFNPSAPTRMYSPSADRWIYYHPGGSFHNWDSKGLPILRNRQQATTLWLKWARAFEGRRPFGRAELNAFLDGLVEKEPEAEPVRPMSDAEAYIKARMEAV